MRRPESVGNSYARLTWFFPPLRPPTTLASARVAVQTGRVPTSPSRRRPGIRPSDASIAKAAAGVLVVLLVVGIALLGGSFLTGHDPAPGRTISRTPSALPSTAMTTSGTPGASGTESPPQPDTAQPRARAMTVFVRGYLGSVTADPAEGWQKLTATFRTSSGGYPSYVRFWRDITRAVPRDITADPKALTVAYDVDYTHRDGSHSFDHTRLRVRFANGDYRIDGEG